MLTVLPGCVSLLGFDTQKGPCAREPSEGWRTEPLDVRRVLVGGIRQAQRAAAASAEPALSSLDIALTLRLLLALLSTAVECDEPAYTRAPSVTTSGDADCRPGGIGRLYRPGYDRSLVISVVIPVLNGCPWLESQLAALSTQRCEEPWEVVVADNGSTDGTRQLVDRWTALDPRIRLVDASVRRGPAAARNIGAADAAGDLLAFCDADDEVQPGWLSACVVGLAKAEVVAGVIDMGLLNGQTPRPLQPAASEQMGFLPAGLGANLAVRRRDFEALGGFSEDLLVGEDIDLCWRFQLGGRRFAMLDAAIVAKRQKQTLSEVFRRSVSYGRSGALLYKRYRDHGAHRQLRRWVRSIGWLIASVPLLRDRSARAPWVHGAGMRIGRVLGSLENKVFFP